MKRKTYRHLTTQVLENTLISAVARGCVNTAEILGLIAEVDDRQVYLAAGYASLYLYCVRKIGMSEDAAMRRIRAARAAREFPAIFGAVADGRLHLSAISMLAPHLTPDNAEELIAAASRKCKAEIEQVLAERFPRPDVPARVQSLAAPAESFQQLVPGRVAESEATPTELPAPRTKVAPLARERFAVQFTMSQLMHDKLRYAEALLSHQIAPGQLAEVLERVLDLAIPQLEKGKFAATDRPRQPRRGSNGSRIPAEMKRAVRRRDGFQCTFVSDDGHRCEARERLEFDHIVALGRGGMTTVSNLRLLCRAHNQYAAACTFGVGFMDKKRSEARRAAAEKRAKANAAEQRARIDAAHKARARAAAEESAREVMDRADEVIPWLRELEFPADPSSCEISANSR